ncbi:hypothetical protein KP509_36G021000 [Ceratopteris richardii]|nr:hypothetical protein KP509_36G021000 [Ceratopteris richardii]
MHFKLAPDSRAKYEQLVNYGKKLKPLPRQYQTLENKVPNCVSQIWVRASIDKAKRIYFEAESDSMVARGVAAVLVEGLSGYPATDILKISPDFIELLTPEQSLTPLRSDGFIKVFRFLQKKASQAMDTEGISGSAKSFTQ